MIKRKWYGVLFAFFILFLYAMGTYDLFKILSFDEGYYTSKGYTQTAIEYFTDYPVGALLLWIANLAFGLLSPILYLSKSKHTGTVAVAAFISDLLLIAWGVARRNRIAALGLNIFYFDIGILLITLLFAIFTCKAISKALK